MNRTRLRTGWSWLLALVVLSYGAACNSEPAAEKGEIDKRDYFDVVSTSADGKDEASKPRANSYDAMEATGTVGTITAGQTINGSLRSDDYLLPDDNSYVDPYTYEGTLGERITITLTSSAFDAYLHLAEGTPSAYRTIAQDDDGAGNSNAQIVHVLPATGTYTILANSYAAGATGSYTLSVTSEAGMSVIAAGTHSGSLSSSDQGFDDGTYFDTYGYQGRAGEQLTVTLNSGAFDAFLMLGVGTPGNMRMIRTDDDGAGGSDAQVSVRLPEDGTYTIVANSYAAGTGDYTLSINAQAARSYDQVYPGGGDPNGQYALLIGINDYPDTDSDLASPVADAEIMRDVLINSYGFPAENIVLLQDEEATRDNIAAAFQRHLGQAGPGGSAVFYYSGHGLQLDGNYGADGSADPEEDGKDEAIYIWALESAGGVLLDDEIGYMVDQLNTDNTLLILDSCHSGTAARGAGGGKVVTYEDVADGLYLPLKFMGASEAMAAAAAGTGSDAVDGMGQRPYVLLSGSQDDEVSWVAQGWPDRGGLASVFTYYLAGGLEQAATSGMTFEQMMQDVRQQSVDYSQATYSRAQTPNVSGPLANRSVAEILGR